MGRDHRTSSIFIRALKFKAFTTSCYMKGSLISNKKLIDFLVILVTYLISTITQMIKLAHSGAENWKRGQKRWEKFLFKKLEKFLFICCFWQTSNFTWKKNIVLQIAMRQTPVKKNLRPLTNIFILRTWILKHRTS